MPYIWIGYNFATLNVSKVKRQNQPLPNNKTSCQKKVHRKQSCSHRRSSRQCRKQKTEAKVRLRQMLLLCLMARHHFHHPSRHHRHVHRNQCIETTMMQSCHQTKTKLLVIHFFALFSCYFSRLMYKIVSN